jgi:hypothetical protein
MARKFDDASLSIGYLRSAGSRRKLTRSRRAIERERAALAQLYGQDFPIAPDEVAADVVAREKVFHDDE